VLSTVDYNIVVDNTANLVISIF